MNNCAKYQHYTKSLQFLEKAPNFFLHFIFYVLEPRWTIAPNLPHFDWNLKSNIRPLILRSLSMNICWWGDVWKSYIGDSSMKNDFYSTPSTNIHWNFSLSNQFIRRCLRFFFPKAGIDWQLIRTFSTYILNSLTPMNAITAMDCTLDSGSVLSQYVSSILLNFFCKDLLSHIDFLRAEFSCLRATPPPPSPFCLDVTHVLRSSSP